MDGGTTNPVSRATTGSKKRMPESFLFQEADGTVRVANTHYAKAAFSNEFNPLTGKVERKRLEGNFAGIDNLQKIRRLEKRRIKRAKQRQDAVHYTPQDSVVKTVPEPGTQSTDDSSTFIFVWRDPSMRVFTCCRCKMFFASFEALVGHGMCTEHVVCLPQTTPQKQQSPSTTSTPTSNNTPVGHDRTPVASAAAGTTPAHFQHHHRRTIQFTVVQFS